MALYFKQIVDVWVFSCFWFCCSFDFVYFILFIVLKIYPENFIACLFDADISKVAEHLGNGRAKYFLFLGPDFNLKDVAMHEFCELYLFNCLWNSLVTVEFKLVDLFFLTLDFTIS